MATPDKTKHEIGYTCGGSAAAKRDSLIGSGPLEVHSLNWFSVVAKDLLPPPVGGKVAISMHDID